MLDKGQCNTFLPSPRCSGAPSRPSTALIPFLLPPEGSGHLPAPPASPHSGVRNDPDGLSSCRVCREPALPEGADTAPAATSGGARRARGRGRRAGAAAVGGGGREPRPPGQGERLPQSPRGRPRDRGLLGAAASPAGTGKGPAAAARRDASAGAPPPAPSLPPHPPLRTNLRPPLPLVPGRPNRGRPRGSGGGGRGCGGGSGLSPRLRRRWRPLGAQARLLLLPPPPPTSSSPSSSSPARRYGAPRPPRLRMRGARRGGAGGRPGPPPVSCPCSRPRAPPARAAPQRRLPRVERGPRALCREERPLSHRILRLGKGLRDHRLRQDTALPSRA